MTTYLLNYREETRLIQCANYLRVPSHVLLNHLFENQIALIEQIMRNEANNPSDRVKSELTRSLGLSS